jgi:hypothetical protein
VVRPTTQDGTKTVGNPSGTDNNYSEMAVKVRKGNTFTEVSTVNHKKQMLMGGIQLGLTADQEGVDFDIHSNDYGMMGRDPDYNPIVRKTHGWVQVGKQFAASTTTSSSIAPCRSASLFHSAATSKTVTIEMGTSPYVWDLGDTIVIHNIGVGDLQVQFSDAGDGAAVTTPFTKVTSPTNSTPYANFLVAQGETAYLHCIAVNDGASQDEFFSFIIK